MKPVSLYTETGILRELPLTGAFVTKKLGSSPVLLGRLSLLQVVEETLDAWSKSVRRDSGGRASVQFNLRVQAYTNLI